MCPHRVSAKDNMDRKQRLIVHFLPSCKTHMCVFKVKVVVDMFVQEFFKKTLICGLCLVFLIDGNLFVLTSVSFEPQVFDFFS